MAKIVVNMKQACGKVYFQDGHTEEIGFYMIYSNDHIIFCTDSGKYRYRAWLEFEETLYCDNNPIMPGYLRHEFCKEYVYPGDYDMVQNIRVPCVEWKPVNIEKLELYDSEDKK